LASNHFSDSGYDRDGNRLYRANLLDSALDELYHANGASNGYDLLGQLTGFARGVLSDANSDGVPDTVSTPSRTQSWDFDELGNWEVLSTDGTPESRTHDRQNKVTGVGSATLTYDDNGNLTTDEAGREFFYDAWNRLVSVEDGSSNPLVDHAYDALGRRILADDGIARHFYYSSSWQVLEEREANAAVAHNIWSLAYIDALVLRDRDADGLWGTMEERLYVHQDANWNVTALVDTSGSVVERYIHDPYGSVTILTPAWGSRGVSAYVWVHLHQGGRYDDASGLYHFRHRDFSPTLGRWVSQDPIGFAGGDANLYRYVHNDPTNRTDPTGLADNSLYSLPSRLGDTATSDEAKDEARRIGDAIRNTFDGSNTPWRLPSWTNDQRNKGYYCYEWAYAFENAFKLESSGKYFTFEVEAASAPDAIGVHYWLKITSKETGRVTYVDDGFANGDYVHTNQPIPGGWGIMHPGVVPKSACSPPPARDHKYNRPVNPWTLGKVGYYGY
jgi:RHS repeat-associated protein